MKKAYKKVGRFRFSLEAVLKLWQFQIVAALILAIPIAILNYMITWVANSTGSAATTANLSSLLNWRLPVIGVLIVLVSLIYFTIEILSLIYFCEDILDGGLVSIREAMINGFKSLRSFLNPKGLLIILFILIGVPLCGMGFSVSLTKNFYIPNFITDVIFANPLYTSLYILVILGLIYIARRSLFVFHFVLIDHLSVSEALTKSKQLVKENGWNLLWRLIKMVIILNAVQYLAYFIFHTIPYYYLETMGAALPKGYTANYLNPEAIDKQVIQYRILCSLAVNTGQYLILLTTHLIAGGYIYRITKIFNTYTNKENIQNYVPYSRKGYFACLAQFVIVLGLVVTYSLVVGYNFETMCRISKKVEITAHRTGGDMASENSLEGIDAAVEHNCYGSETDIQRTADNHYIINHDNDFKRLTGDSHKPGELTLEQIKELRIVDTTGNGNLLEVPTMEELLDYGKGRIILLLELKGASADKQMADDVVAAVRERDMAGDVMIISLNYDVIDYVEKTYPEFETGVLIFSALGDVSNLNCDMVIMEEEMSSSMVIDSVHASGKKVGVWTVNTEYSMHHFLDSNVDTIITDKVELAINVQKELDDRTDLQIIEDKAAAIFK